MPIRTLPPSLDELLAAFDAAPDTGARTMVAIELSRMRLRDDRIVAAIVRLLDEDPVGAAAACLALHGDDRALPHLVRAFDSEELLAKADCAICAAGILAQLAHAIELLGGRLTEAQVARLMRVAEEADRLWIRMPDPLPARPAAPEPARREARQGRNALCRCGSGKKYKRCCAVERNDGGGLH